MSRKAPIWYLWLLAAVILGLDIITKMWALDVLANAPSRQIIGDFLQFTYTRNTGVAFGLFADKGLPLGWLSVIALVVVVWLAVRPSGREPWRATALGLILGGAIGNLIDRFRWGSVIDFIDVGIGTLRWPVFNIADSAITVGVVIWSALLFFAPHPKEVEPAADTIPREGTADNARSS